MLTETHVSAMQVSTESVATQPVQKSSKFASGCLFVFALPFAAGGVLAAYQVVATLRDPQRVANDVVGLAVFAFLFCAAGFGMMAFAIYNLRHGDDVPEVERRYPAQPWMWRKDWADGRISDHSKAGVIGLWFFAVVWSGISVPLAWMLLRNEPEKKGAFFVLIFPLVGVGLVVAAIYRTLRHLRYGNSYFVLASRPGVIGRSLQGTVETRFRQAPGTVSIRLSAIRRVTSGSGKSRSTSEHVKWQDASEIDGASLPMGPHGTNIPVSFEIPADAPETDNRNRDNELVWRLEISADVPGVDYSTTFEVPVFNTGAVPLSEEELQAARTRRRSRVRGVVPAESKVVISNTPRGGTEFLFPPRRKLGSTLGGLAFLAVWFAFVVGLAMFGAPMAFPGIFGAVGLLLLAAFAGSLFYVARVTVEASTLTIRHSVLGLGPAPRVLKLDEVKDITVHFTGEGKAITWELKAKMADGQEFSAAAMIPEQREAEWIAEKIRQAIRFQGAVSPLRR
jgi:hypothetical protein